MSSPSCRLLGAFAVFFVLSLAQQGGKRGRPDEGGWRGEGGVNARDDGVAKKEQLSTFFCKFSQGIGGQAGWYGKVSQRGTRFFFATLCSLNEDPFSSPLHRWHPSLPPPPPPFWPLFVERSCPPPDCDPHTLLRLGPPTKEGKGPPVCLPWQGRGPGDGIAASCPFCVLCMNRARAKKKRRKRPPKKRLHLAINDLRLLLLLLSRGGGVGRRGRLAPLSPSSLPPLKFKSTHA